MLVFSDVPGLCDYLGQVEPPPYDNWWMSSVWTMDGIKLQEEQAADGWLTYTTSGAGWEFYADSAVVEFNELEEDVLSGKLRMFFDTKESIYASFEAEYCDVDLFLGLEG